MKAFKKLFIKNYEDVANPNVRFRYGIVAGIFGIISNLVLCGLKLLVGLLSGSITIIADAVNNLSDAGSSVVTVFGFKLSSRPADKEHPYGHARWEYISGFMVAFLVLAIGVLLAKSSIEKIISPTDISVSAVTYAVLAVAIAVKLVQMFIYLDFAKSIGSQALKASAADSRNDVLTTTAVLIATVIIQTTKVNIDGYAGLLVSVFIIVSAIKLIKDTIDPLLGTVPDAGQVEKIKEKLLSYDGVLGIHDLLIHNYGAASCFATVHVEMDAKGDILAMHDVLDNIERDFARDPGIMLTIHMDPIETDNPEITKLRELVRHAIFCAAPEISIHDFRMVRGNTHTNILFDVVIPYDSKLTHADIERIAKEAVSAEEPDAVYYFVINVDRVYV